MVNFLSIKLYSALLNKILHLNQTYGREKHNSFFLQLVDMICGVHKCSAKFVQDIGFGHGSTKILPAEKLRCRICAIPRYICMLLSRISMNNMQVVSFRGRKGR